MHSARRGLSQLLIFKFLRHIFIRHSVLRKASRLKSYCKFNNYFLNPHLFLKKSFGFNFRLQIKASITQSPIQSLFTKFFDLYGRVIVHRKEIFRIMTLYYMMIFVIYISVIIFFYKLLSFLMISKGSWVALATSSAESPIASKRCAVSV